LLEEGRRTVATAETALKRVDGVIAKATPGVEKIVNELASESGRLNERLNQVQGKLVALLTTADSLVGLQQSEVAEIVRTLRNTMWELEMAVRKVRSNPAFLIFGDDEERLEAEPRDDSGLRRRGSVKPYDQRDETEKRKD
jgi:hypothetical protein